MALSARDPEIGDDSPAPSVPLPGASLPWELLQSGQPEASDPVLHVLVLLSLVLGLPPLPPLSKICVLEVDLLSPLNFAWVLSASALPSSNLIGPSRGSRESDFIKVCFPPIPDTSRSTRCTTPRCHACTRAIIVRTTTRRRAEERTHCVWVPTVRQSLAPYP